MTTAIVTAEGAATPASTSRRGLNARLSAWVKRHPRLAALLVIAL